MRSNIFLRSRKLWKVIFYFKYFSDIKTSGSPVGYQGCIRRLSVNNNEVNLRYPGPSVKKQVNVLPSCGSSPCQKRPCLNGATCFATSARSYQCRCPVGFQGTDCEVRGIYALLRFGIILKYKTRTSVVQTVPGLQLP